MTCISNLVASLPNKCKKFPPIGFSFLNGKCYKNGIYYGFVISRNYLEIKVQYDGDNKYLKGEVIVFKLVQK